MNMRVLFIEDMIPMSLIGSGFVRSTDIIEAMASLGYRVTVYPIKRSDFGLASTYADMPDTAEIMHDGELADLAKFPTARRCYYDVICIARAHNLDRLRPLFEHVAGATGRLPRIVLDTEVIASFTLKVEGKALDTQCLSGNKACNGAAFATLSKPKTDCPVTFVITTSKPEERHGSDVLRGSKTFDDVDFSG